LLLFLLKIFLFYILFTIIKALYRGRLLISILRNGQGPSIKKRGESVDQANVYEAECRVKKEE